jgi:hypothetical protein
MQSHGLPFIFLSKNALTTRFGSIVVLPATTQPTFSLTWSGVFLDSGRFRYWANL